ncbi:MAG: restriction endonuclease subunit S [Flavobacterium sp.]|nr:restriction endonuclease subunit S [Flavobacterium sp.]
MSSKKVKLGDLCSIEKGKTGIQKAIPGEYPLVVTAEDRKSNNEYQFDDEAVIIPLVSGTGHGHASIKRLHFQTGKFALGSILCAVIPKDKSVLNAEYLFRFLNLNKERELVDRMKGMANVTLPIKEIAKIEIPLPSLEEQIEFVEKYSILETDSEEISIELEHQLELINQLRQAFLREAMQGKLVKSTNSAATGQQLLAKIKAEKAQLIAYKKLKKEKELLPITEDEIPFEIPEHWAWCRLGEIINISSGDGLTSSQMDKKGIIPVYGGNGITGYHSEFTVQKETIVIGRVGYYCGCVHLTEKKAWITDNAFNVKYSEENINREFLIQLIKWAELGKQQFAGSQPVISGQRVYPKLIPLPPLNEQEQIVTKLEQLMAFCDGLEQSIKESQGYNEKLLQQVLREALQVEEI